MLLSASTGIAAPWAVYGIWADSWGGTAKLKEFYGCAFPIRQKGAFCMCSHVLPTTVSDDEILVIQHPTDSKCHKIISAQRHRKYDMAIFFTDLSVPYCLMHEGDELLLGEDVSAYGYYDWRRDGTNLLITPQFHKGYITATPRIGDGLSQLPLPWYQLSFPVPNGFSGSPLYHQIDNEGLKIVGMVNESKVTEISGVTLQLGRSYPSHLLTKHIDEILMAK
jgi:hypothetical protein